MDTSEEIERVVSLYDELAEPMAHATGEANRRIRAIQRIKAEQRRVGELVAAEAARLFLYQGEKDAAAKKEIARLEAWLKSFHAAVLAEDPKAITVDLPAGKLIARKAADKWAYVDEKALVAWLEENLPEAVRTPTPANEVDKAKLRKLAVVVVDGVSRFVRVGDQMVPHVLVTNDEEIMGGEHRTWELKLVAAE